MRTALQPISASSGYSSRGSRSWCDDDRRLRRGSIADQPQNRHQRLRRRQAAHVDVQRRRRAASGAPQGPGPAFPERSSSRELAQQPLRERRGDLAAVIGARRRRPHRADLLLHQLAECSRASASSTARPAVHRCLRAATDANWCRSARRAARRCAPPSSAQRHRDTGQRKVDRAAHARLAIAATRARAAAPARARRQHFVGARASDARRRRRDTDRPAAPGARRGADRSSTSASNAISAGARSPLNAAWQRSPCGATWHVVAAALQAVVVAGAPPRALVVEHAARVEAQIAADASPRCDARAPRRSPPPAQAPETRARRAASAASAASVTPAPIARRRRVDVDGVEAGQCR